MSLESLLTQISTIQKKYEEIYKRTGENFNIFNLLNLSYDEISHSKIIAALLNPKGMHGKGNIFIEKFLDCIEIGINDFSRDNIIIKIEKSIGNISEDYTEGGRMDIVITNGKNQQIFIENKIYAPDQWNQLLRYYHHNEKAHLIYLTLPGDDPSEKSTGKEPQFKYKPISYKKHILEWLELCKLESIDNPILRETLTQYIVLIKQLTGQARSNEMKEEFMSTILENEDNFLTAFTLFENININEIKLKILKEKFEPIINSLAGRLGFEEMISFDGCLKINDWGFSFKKPEWKAFRIDFAFNTTDLKNLVYGFCPGRACYYYSTNISKKLEKYLWDLPRNLNPDKNQYWLLYRSMDNYRDWDKDFFWEIFTGKSPNIINELESKIEEISAIAEEAKNKGFEL